MRGVNGQKKIEEIMAVNFPNLIKNIHLHILESQQISSRINTKRSTLGDVITIVSKDEDKERILKLAREKQLVMKKGEFYQTWKKELTPILLKLFQKNKTGVNIF